MSCGTKTLKISSFILDFLCCIIAALTISACAYALATFTQSNAIRVPCILGIVLSVLLFGSTILGCVAVLREHIKLTWIYAGILMFITCAQVTTVFVQPINFERLANETIANAWQKELYQNNSMSYYEIKYQCCGKSGPQIYIDSGLKIPASCYLNQNTTIAPDLFPNGCNTCLAKAYAKGTRWELICDWSVVGVELLTIMVAGLLAITLQNAARRRLYR